MTQALQPFTMFKLSTIQHHSQTIHQQFNLVPCSTFHPNNTSHHPQTMHQHFNLLSCPTIHPNNRSHYPQTIHQHFNLLLVLCTTFFPNKISHHPQTLHKHFNLLPCSTFHHNTSNSHRFIIQTETDMACEELKNTDPNWETEEAIAEDLDLPKWSTKNVVKLLEEGCTIPFIARYRKEMTGGMEVDNLRDIQSSLEDLKHVQNKMATVLKAINKLGKLTQGLEKCLKNSKTITEVDDLYAPFKPGHKGTLAERARALNLEPLAITFLERPWEGLQKLSDVETGVKHILADIIHKHKDSMDFIRGWSKYRDIKLVTSECKPKKSGKNEDSKTVKNAEMKKLAHQGTYAMNIITQAISDAYDRLAHPQMIRLIRSELTKKAEKASIEVFATNLKNLLLASPVKGKCILGLDPGFKNGCKVAVITSTGQIVHTEIVYIHDYKK
ncbi:unnamed protein product [Mytilus edulis]|uniref:Uncharacterized protein n=1 Tax=Mytilus edulis TaxID=6550 RepID=A0A8S3TVX6_MYTED|nr:unnamed protein product [Mytilus edulis]